MTGETTAAAEPAQQTAEQVQDAYYASRQAEIKTEATPAPAAIPEPPTLDMPKDEAKAPEPEAAPAAPESESAKAEEAKTEEPAEEDGDKPEDDAKPEEPKKSRRTLREENFRLRERNRALTAEAELLRTRQQPEAPKPAETSKPELKRPKQEDFENYDAYLDARDDYNRKQWRAEEDERQRQRDNERSLQSQQSESTERFNQSAEKARKVHQDFDEAVWELGYKIRGETAALIAQTDNPGEVAYWLSQNLDEAARIAKLPDAKAAIELGKIEAKVAATVKDPPKPQPKAETKPVPETKAPPPTKTIPNGTARPTKSLEELPQEDYYARRRAEDGPIVGR